MRSILFTALAACAVLAAFPSCTDAKSAPVPAECTPRVNRQLGELIDLDRRAPVDNVMVCGTTSGPSRPQRGGPHGGHQLIPVLVRFEDGGTAMVEVVTNDALDGRVTAPRGAKVFAFGQYFATTARQRPYVAGIHEVHCATHRGAADGWVVVDGRRAPTSC